MIDVPTGYYKKHETALVDEGAQIGEGTKVWHFAHIMPGAKIGKNCVIGQNVFVGGKAVIGDRCKIQNNVSVYDGVVLEDEVFLGPSCVLTNDRVPSATGEWEITPTLIKRGASVGANATIVCGVTIGEGSLVGAGAVVTKDVPPGELWVGNPARKLRNLDQKAKSNKQNNGVLTHDDILLQMGEGEINHKKQETHSTSSDQPQNLRDSSARPLLGLDRNDKPVSFSPTTSHPPSPRLRTTGQSPTVDDEGCRW